MKSYEQRTENITKKAEKITARRQSLVPIVACVCCLAIVCGIVLATVPDGNSFNIDAYKDSEYFPLIQKINSYNEKRGTVDDVTNVDGWLEERSDSVVPDSSGSSSAPGSSDGSSSSPSIDDRYVESTLNQVAGVTEGDILKRSQNYAFYLTSNKVTIDDKWNYHLHISAYSISGENSALVGEFVVKPDEGARFSQMWYITTSTSSTEMYLSEDAKTLTIVTNCENEDRVYYTCVISLDVSDPSNMYEKTRTYVAGSYLSSRKVNGELLLVTKFFLRQKPNFNDLETFIPSYGSLAERTYLKMNEIYCPEYLSECTYTVVAKINESNLEITSKQAVLSYAYDVAVSTEHIFIIRNRGEFVQNDISLGSLAYAGDGPAFFRRFSEIVCLEYSDEIQNVGCVKLDGMVNDRYSLDEKDGILRAVTQTTRYEYTVTHSGAPHPNVSLDASLQNASLHCVDLAEMKIVNSVENFAPNGELVQAVRFNGDRVYVCTSIRNTDPVFAFDLTDINNITYKDTGTIPGYSINLLKFGDYLLGIGYGEVSDILKIELYKENDSAVESVAIYENDYCNFSTNYKAHFIDAEHQLVGLQITDYCHPYTPDIFLLLQFDSETQTWREILCQRMRVDHRSDKDFARAFYTDGLYLIGNKTPLTFFSESDLFGQSAE
ncbi:MAG: beta-propeller domain-containing protein [Clostridiales bacterium]|nr:beta-propeller domain-containing protein [Clostridiales bacterium]